MTKIIQKLKTSNSQIRSRAIFIIFLIIPLVLVGCSSDSEISEVQTSGRCEIPGDISRKIETPVGVLLPSGDFERQSYKSAQEILDAGLNSLSLGWTFYYTKSGEIVFDFDGSSDENAKQRWIDQISCSVIEAKNSGLIVSVWGQFQEAGDRGEPMGMPAEIKDLVLEKSLNLIPEVSQILEKLKVEYWSPISELDKYAGIDGHNEYFSKMVEKGKPNFKGIIYSQPNILQRDSFFVQQVEPVFGQIDALGISWISYECEPDKLKAADYVVESAKKQGIGLIFISELGSTNFADESFRPCLEELIEYWDGASSGVFILDNPQVRDGVATIKDSWQESVLKQVSNRL